MRKENGGTLMNDLSNYFELILKWVKIELFSVFRSFLCYIDCSFFSWTKSKEKSFHNNSGVPRKLLAKTLKLSWWLIGVWWIVGLSGYLRCINKNVTTWCEVKTHHQVLVIIAVPSLLNISAITQQSVCVLQRRKKVSNMAIFFLM